MVFRFSAIILWVFFSISPAGADHTDGYHGEEGYYSEETGSEFSSPEGLLNSTTNDLVGNLASANQRCMALDIIYRFDCLRQHYKMLASRLEDNPAYAIPLQALRDIEETLDAIVAQNADPAVEPVRKRGKTYRPINPAATAKATEAYNQALTDASTILLRSSNDNARHFARIAKALDSNKILLRSALLLFFHVPQKASDQPHDQGTWQVI